MLRTGLAGEQEELHLLPYCLSNVCEKNKVYAQQFVSKTVTAALFFG